MRNLLIVGLLVLFAGSPLVFPWLTAPLTIALGLGFAALGVGLLLRADLISLGHAMFYAFGAYVVAIAGRSMGLHDLVLLLVAAIVLTSVFGWIVGLFMVRYRGIFFAMLNLAASMVFFALVAKLYNLTGGTDGMTVLPARLLGMAPSQDAGSYVLLYVGLLLAIVLVVLGRPFLRGPFGSALTAAGNNEIRVGYLGVSVGRVLLVAYTISAGLAGLGGAISALAIGRVLPDMAYWTESGEILLMAVLGGTGGAAGPFIGAVFLTLVRIFAAGYAANVWNLIVGVALLLVIFFAPGGIYSLARKLLRADHA